MKDMKKVSIDGYIDQATSNDCLGMNVPSPPLVRKHQQPSCGWH